MAAGRREYMNNISAIKSDRPVIALQVMPAPTSAAKPARQDMSVILVTGSYDHEIRFWEAWSGICSRTIARTGESGVSLALSCACASFECISASKPSGYIPGVSYGSRVLLRFFELMLPQ